MHFKCFMLLLLSALLLSGRARVVYEEVLIPTKCNVAKRERPSKSGKVSVDVKAIFAYTQALERDLKNVQRRQDSMKAMPKLKRFWFYFRWFLIGKYHCNISPSYKRFWFVIHKALWGVIIICVALSIGRVIEGGLL